MTPISERIRHDLDTRYFLLDRDKLTPWLLGRAANHDPGIIDCRGRAIAVGLGCVFDGQLRSIFWRFIRPCVEDAIQEVCDRLESAIATYSTEQRSAAIADVQVLLQAFSSKIYDRMRTLDLSMRKKSQTKYVEPDNVNVEPYDASNEIRSAHELITRKLRIIRQHFDASTVADERLPTLSDVVDSKVRLFGISLDRKILWQWLKARCRSWWLSAKQP